MNHVLLVYDITNDRARTKIADACMDYGLDRIQFSAFYGQLSRNRQEELILCIGDILGSLPGRIKLIPISDQNWNKSLEIDNAG